MVPPGRIVLIVGCCAASERYKGVDDLIHAVARFRATFSDLHLVAVGGVKIFRVFERLLHVRVSLKSNLLEGLSREEIAVCYARSDLFALPSTGEGFGLVFFEAIVFTKPVVGAVCGGTTDIVQNGTISAGCSFRSVTPNGSYTGSTSCFMITHFAPEWASAEPK